MKKSIKNNEKGFGIIESIAILVIGCLIGGVCWYVWRSNNKSNSEQNTYSASDEQAKLQKSNSEAQKADTIDGTEDWTVFSSSKGWQLKVPDGWKLYTDTSSNGLAAYSSLEYKPGTRAIIEKTSSGRGGPSVLNTGNYAAGDPATQTPDYLTDETVFKAKNVEGRKYTGTLKEDVPMEGSKGDVISWYVFVKDTKSVIFMHYQSKDAKSIISELEKSLSTLEFK